VTDFLMRPATAADAAAIHTLIVEHQREGRLLPRQIDELERHADRFFVCELDGGIVACAELAPLSRAVCEVRSLVVASHARRVGLAARVVSALRDKAQRFGFETLSAFTHDARFFVRQGFSIVPHMWVPEKITTDCLGCALFRQCRQYAMILPLHAIHETARPASAPLGVPARVA
jgi:N-acetylglutamate synthase-like GNAT family acetyltransferase